MSLQEEITKATKQSQRNCNGLQPHMTLCLLPKYRQIIKSIMFSYVEQEKN